MFVSMYVNASHYFIHFASLHQSTVKFQLFFVQKLLISRKHLLSRMNHSTLLCAAATVSLAFRLGANVKVSIRLVSYNLGGGEVKRKKDPCLFCHQINVVLLFMSQCALDRLPFYVPDLFVF